ncbi:MAG: ribonuclease Y [Verrucomicrobia bacterium]|jgi:ribonucrease Y|nr:ribonuclease Y [Verrucomicrobiota bacterium]
MSGIIAGVVAGVVGLAAGYLIRQAMGRVKANTDEDQAKRLLTDAKREAETLRKEGTITAKADVLKAREAFEKSTESRRKELAAIEERVGLRETNLDRKVSLIDRKEHAVDEKLAEIEKRDAALEEERVKIARLIEEEKQNLQRVAGMTQDEARQTLLTRMEKEVHGEIGGLIRRMQEQAKDTAERESKRIITQAIQRYASSHTSDIVTSAVALPSDDMKGRIIGRDGRNIRALEAATGVNFLVDDTPEAVVVSGFDPVRREIAKQALERLLADGRIHPARIEEVVVKATEDMTETIRTAGEETLFEVGIQGVDPELVRTLGRLKFRTSYTQNVLRHSVEVAQLMGLMAGEMGLDPQIAKRVGLFHDIGKALDHEVEGGHAIIGADLLKRLGESQEIVNAVAAHHEDVEAQSLYAVLCSAADAMSSSRVGARSESSGRYIKRLEKLEAIANDFEGVEKSYAIQAGREVRVIVEPDKIDDAAAMVLARNISKKIETDLQYPGQIRITAIRETRCVEYAK